MAKISQSAASMLERIDAMEQEANSLLAALRTGADRLGADLRLLESDLADVKAAIAPPSEEPEDDVEVVAAAVVLEEEDEPEAEPEATGCRRRGDHRCGRARRQGEAAAPGAVDDLEGARLIALNMALNGNSREEIDRYLDENFELNDRDALLDEVYSSVEG